MPRTEIISEWTLPRYVATSELQDVFGEQIQDVNWESLFIIWTSGVGELVPLVDTTWN